jgi:uncharacterized alpha-E superfamily protein
MLSRVANSIYWMTRYLERVDNYARLVGSHIHLNFDLPEGLEKRWIDLLNATCDKEGYFLRNDSFDIKSLFFDLCFEENNPFSMHSSLRNCRENLKSVKEVLPKEVWEHVNVFYHDFRSQISAVNASPENWLPFLEKVKFQCQLFYGIIDTSLSRKEAYYFYNTGKFIERLDKSSRFLDIGAVHTLAQENDQESGVLFWSAILKTVSAYNMYRQSYKSLDKQSIVKFLVTDRFFPRSVSFCNFKATEALLKLGSEKASQEAQMISEFVEDHFSDIPNLNNLSYLLNEIQVKNNQLHLIIAQQYF